VAKIFGLRLRRFGPPVERNDQGSTARGASIEGFGDLSRFNQHNAMSFDDGVHTKALVKWFNVAKGFGFVAPADGTPDAFLHISVLNRIGLQELGEGAEVVCQIVQGPKGPQVSRVIDVVSSGSTPGPRGARPDSRRDSGPSVELSGTVKWFKPDKGFGFVTADDADKDVFVHKSVLRRCNLTQLESGQRVHMKVQEAEKGREATWITLI
jgi:CspA family cold shock protein